MKKVNKKIIAPFLFGLGVLLIFSVKIGITGAVLGTAAIAPSWISIIGMTMIIVSAIIFTGDLGARVEENFKDLVKKHHWSTYPRAMIPRDSMEIDREMGYLHKPRASRRRITPMQERIERSVTGGELIIPYVRKDSDEERSKYRGEETVNKRETYEQQFFEGHAAKGGRIIKAESHLRDGRLYHFSKLADGEYVWVVDSDGEFILGERQKMLHDMPQMPLNTGSQGIKEDKRKTILPHSTLARGKDVYGAGEVEVKGGLIQSYNCDSGHYAKRVSDVEGPQEPESYVSQSKDIFKYFCKRIGWKEKEGGAKFKSKL